MRLKRLGPSMTELEYIDGTRVLYSYETPCAVCCGGSYIRTDRYISNTTSGHGGHIERWLAGARAATVKHEEILRIAERE